MFECVAFLCRSDLPRTFLHWSSFNNVEELALLGLKDALVVDAFLVVVATLLSQQGGGTVVLFDSSEWNVSADNMSLECSPWTSECTNFTSLFANLASALSLFLATELSFLFVLDVLFPCARDSSVLLNCDSNESTLLVDTLANIVATNSLGDTSPLLFDSLSAASGRNIDLEGNSGTFSNSLASWFGFLALKTFGNVWIASLWLSVDADLLLGTSKGSLSFSCTSASLLDLVVEFVNLIDCSSVSARLFEFLASWSITLFNPRTTELLLGISKSLLEGTFSSLDVDNNFASPFASFDLGTLSCLAFSGGGATELLFGTLVGLEFAEFRSLGDNWESYPNTSLLCSLARLSNSSKASLLEVTTVFLNNILALLFHGAFLLSRSVNWSGSTSADLLGGLTVLSNTSMLPFTTEVT